MELEKLLESEIDDCPCGKKHRIPTREVHLQAGSLQNLPQVADRSITGKTIVCVADANTWSVAGEEAVRMLSGTERIQDAPCFIFNATHVLAQSRYLCFCGLSPVNPH